MPPALVARLPPIVQLPSAPRESGNSRPAAAAASCTVCRTTPASTVIVSLAASIPRIRRIRVSESTTCVPDESGTAPPQSPVFPPWGTTATPASRHSATTAATSSVLPGRTTAAARPR